MTKPVVFIDGAEGTTGLQIRERLAGRDDITLSSIPAALRKNEDSRKYYLNSADLVILCLPDEASRQAVGMIENPKTRVIDASTAFRTDPAWTYGFPELNKDQADHIRQARFVANPGCYATAAIALLAPLVQSGIATDYDIYTIYGVSGYSGAGRKTIELCEGRSGEPLPSGYQMYALGQVHKHVPEIVQHVGLKRMPVFTPSIDNKVRQGMLVSIPFVLSSLIASTCETMKTQPAQIVHSILARHYKGCTSVRVMPFEKEVSYFDGRLSLDGLAGKDHMELYVIPYERSNAALLVARLDNLGKGASGAAVQNMNLMLGL